MYGYVSSIRTWIGSLFESSAPPKVFGEYEPICDVPSEPNKHFTQEDISAWSCWEKWARNLPEFLKKGTIRETLDQLPEFPWESILKANIAKYINLAFVLLSFAVNAYVRVPSYQLEANDVFLESETDPMAALPYEPSSFDTTPLAFLPDKYAIPILKISERMATAPLLSYQSVAVFNFTHEKNGRNLELNDFKVRYTFTGTPDEQAFYEIPLYIDYLGTFIRESMDELFEVSTNSVTGFSTFEKDAKMVKCLTSINKQCEQIQKELGKMWKSCSKKEFNLFRFFYNGFHGDSIYTEGLRYGENGPIITAHGASAAQSPTIHLLSKFLGMPYCPFLQNQFSMLSPKVKGIIDEAGTNGKKFRERYVNKCYPSILAAWNELVEVVVNVRKTHRSFVQKYIDSGNGTGGTPKQLLDTIIKDNQGCRVEDSKIEKSVSNVPSQAVPSLTLSPVAEEAGSKKIASLAPEKKRNHSFRNSIKRSSENRPSHKDRRSDEYLSAIEVWG